MQGNENTKTDEMQEDPRETIAKMVVELEAARCDNMMLAIYAAKKLKEDLKQGMDIGLQDLRILLNAIGQYIET